MTQQHGLTWGTLDFVSETPTADGYVIEAIDGTSFGNPVPITETIASLLTDGSLVHHERTDNRTITIQLRISAPTATAGTALAKAEAALMAQSGSRSAGDELPPLTWTPPADGALPCVYDVIYAWPDRVSEQADLDEVLREERNYTLTITCLPFARASAISTETFAVTGKQDEELELVIDGSAPTSGGLRLYSTSGSTTFSTDDLLLYTAIAPEPIGALPVPASLRAHVFSSATVTNDTAMRSGKRNPLSSPMVFKMTSAYADALDGTYALMARVNVVTAGTITWSARMIGSSGSASITSGQVVSGSLASAATSGYQILTLGSLTLPVVAADAGATWLELTITGPSDTVVDDVYLFSLDRGALTWIRRGALTTAVKWVEVRSPSIGDPYQSVYAGESSIPGDSGQCVSFACESFGSHALLPGYHCLAFVSSEATTGTVTAQVRYYARYHTHVVAP